MTGIHCSAPGRCGIIGNPTDMYGGAVISCTVPFRAHASVTPCDGLLLETAGVTFEVRTEDDLRLRGDLFDVARSVLDYIRTDQLHCRIRYSSEIPMGSGVSSSTALTVAILAALLRYQGHDYSHYRIAELARYTELNHLRIICGYQDAYMCTFGGLNYMDFRGKAFYRHAAEELYATVEPLDRYVPHLPMLLAHTGQQHSSDAVHRPLRERWLEGDREVRDGYEQITRLAQEGKKALLLQEWPRLGRLMNENHAIQRALGGSGEANEQLIRRALAHGSWGAKLAGAGGGGTIIALHPDPPALEQALHKEGVELTFPPRPVPGVCYSEEAAS
ncbi:MAG: galactokinase family protein [Anaerolineae bacterium]|jgi:galactokinase/mevalonate kinase-like predicted kinase|nr:hypothetical protein [Chloroflexota bacterium]